MPVLPQTASVSPTMRDKCLGKVTEAPCEVEQACSPYTRRLRQEDDSLNKGGKLFILWAEACSTSLPSGIGSLQQGTLCLAYEVSPP